MTLRDLALGVEARDVALDELLEKLPSWLELVDGHRLMPRFRDQRSGERWRLFTGGEFELGATKERQDRLDALLGQFPMRLGYSGVHLPVRRVTVRSFLMMESVLFEGDDEQIVIFEHELEVPKLLTSRGARLPTEAEWEYAWHALQLEPDGWVVGSAELCADAWEPDYRSLGELDPRVKGEPGVLRAGVLDPESSEFVLPRRQPLASSRLATIRPTLDAELTAPQSRG